MTLSPLIMISDVKRVAKSLEVEVLTRSPKAALIIDAAAPDWQDRGGSGLRFYTSLGLRAEVCDPLTEKLPEISQFDVIHLSGGNPFRIMKASEKSGLQTALEERMQSSDCLIVGSSAGAMVFGEDISHALILQPKLGLKSTSGFGWVPGRVMPHMDLSGKYGDIIRDYVNSNPDEAWTLLNEKSLINAPKHSEPALDFNL